MTYRAAIVGCGRIGSSFNDDPLRRGVWTHAGAYAACGATELVAVADLDPAAVERCQRRWGLGRGYRDYAEMLAAERPDIVSVCTPSDSHAAVLLTALESGARAIWCEKPLTTSVAEADLLVAKAGDRPVAVNHVRRWDGAYEMARQWLAAQAGTVRAATAWYTGGVANIGSHLFDTLRFLLGKPAWVLAFSKTLSTVDRNLSGVIGMANDMLCHVNGCGGDDLLVFEIDIVGSEGRLRIGRNGAHVEAWEARASDRYSGYRELAGAKLIWEGDDERRMVAVVEDLVGCLEQGGQPRCTLDDGRQAVELVSAFLISADRGARVDLPLTTSDRARAIPVR